MRSFSTCLVALATLAGATAVSYAADLPGTPTKAPAVVKVPSWQGFYLGINAGYGFSRGDVTEGTISAGVTALANNSDLDMSGFVGGGQIGYNWMITPAVLLGFEADIQTAQQKGQEATSFTAVLVQSVESRLRWFGTARGRLGAVTNGTTLWYLTGGLAYGKAETEISLTTPGDPRVRRSIRPAPAGRLAAAWNRNSRTTGRRRSNTCMSTLER
jgi:outer membrane immunogenic protein